SSLVSSEQASPCPAVLVAARRNPEERAIRVARMVPLDERIELGTLPPRVTGLARRAVATIHRFSHISRLIDRSALHQGALKTYSCCAARIVSDSRVRSLDAGGAA